MSSFTKPLIMEFRGRRKWVLHEAFEYKVGSVDSASVITVPQGFITDGASVPRAFWAFLDPWGRWAKAAVIHDYLYWHRTITESGEVREVTKKEADAIFLEAMGVLNVGFTARWAIYLAVRWFGGIAWNRAEIARNRLQ